ncbi:MAG: ATP-binding cassette domain-containing protein, partial [Phycisphaerales bacterium]|nr:ATP-binding cassette domain-containing protein [Phycisphaerales bacterium]
YQPASAGTARIAGHDVFRESMAVRRVIGYLPESAPIYPEMRVREYLRFRATLRGVPASSREAAIDRVAERAWIKDVITRPIGQLSKGYRQRVGLADALLHDPKVLILDEPTVGLDPSQIRETRSLIRELAEQHTVMLSSHILPEVEATCRRLVMINRGKIVAAGSVDELRQQVTGRSRIVAEVRGSSDQVVAAIRELNGVSDVAVSELVGDEPGWLSLRIETSEDVREALHQLTVTHQWPLRELRREVASLEEFFVNIVAGASQADRAGAA